MKKMRLFLSVVSAVFFLMTLGGCSESGKKQNKTVRKKKKMRRLRGKKPVKRR